MTIGTREPGFRRGTGGRSLSPARGGYDQTRVRILGTGRSFRPRRWTMVTLVSVAWLAIGMTVPLTGTVEDAAGRPVARASVWLGDTNAVWKGPEVLATAETDEKGVFRLERAATGRAGRELVADALGLQAGRPHRVPRIQARTAGRRRVGPPGARSAGLDPLPGVQTRRRARPGGEHSAGSTDRQGPATAGQDARPARRDDRRRRSCHARRRCAGGRPLARRHVRRPARPVPAGRPRGWVCNAPPARRAQGPARRRRSEGPQGLGRRGVVRARPRRVIKAPRPTGVARRPAPTAGSTSLPWPREPSVGGSHLPRVRSISWRGNRRRGSGPGRRGKPGLPSIGESGSRGWSRMPPMVLRARGSRSTSCRWREALRP